jgi:hypothetical protein
VASGDCGLRRATGDGFAAGWVFQAVFGTIWMMESFRILQHCKIKHV